MRSMALFQVVGMALAVTLIVAAAPAAAATETVATFADPSQTSDECFFTVDLTGNRIYGEWVQGNSGLDLEVVLAGMTYPDAFFTLTGDDGFDGIAYNHTGFYGETGGGVLEFFDSDAAPLLQVEFDAAFLTPGGMASDELLSLNVVDIRGDALPFGGAYLVEESFGFSFTNQQLLNPGEPGEGFEATAAFTSAATVPEPSVVVLLGVGALTLVRRRRD